MDIRAEKWIGNTCGRRFQSNLIIDYIVRHTSNSYNMGRRDVLDLLIEPEGVVNKSNTF